MPPGLVRPQPPRPVPLHGALHACNPVGTPPSRRPLCPQWLPLHQDLVYYESGPGVQLLHCVQFDDSVEGGFLTFLDLFGAVEVVPPRWRGALRSRARGPLTLGFAVPFLPQKGAWSSHGLHHCSIGPRRSCTSPRASPVRVVTIPVRVRPSACLCVCAAVRHNTVPLVPGIHYPCPHLPHVTMMWLFAYGVLSLYPGCCCGCVYGAASLC